MSDLEKIHKTSFKIITLAGLSAILVFMFMQFTGMRDTPLNDFSSLIMGLVFLISSIICFIYYKKIDRGAISTTILNTAIANLLFALGSFLWSIYNIFMQIEIPYPSLVDVFYIIMPINYAIAIGSLLQIYKSSTKTSTAIISVIIFTILASIMFFLVGRPEISRELSFWENFFNFAYPLSNSVYVSAGVALLVIAGGKIFRGILIWVLAMFTIAIADQLFTYRASLDLAWNGDIADQIYVLSAIIFTYAVIYLAKISDRRSVGI